MSVQTSSNSKLPPLLNQCIRFVQSDSAHFLRIWATWLNMWSSENWRFVATAAFLSASSNIDIVFCIVMFLAEFKSLLGLNTLQCLKWTATNYCQSVLTGANNTNEIEMRQKQHKGPWVIHGGRTWFIFNERQERHEHGCKFCLCLLDGFENRSLPLC